MYWGNKIPFISLLLAILGISFSWWLCEMIKGEFLSKLGDFSYQVYLLSWFPQIFFRVLLGQIFFYNVWIRAFCMLVGGLLLPIYATLVLNKIFSKHLRVFYGA